MRLKGNGVRLLHAAGLVSLAFANVPAASAAPVSAPAPKLDTILYGAAYHNEYIPEAAAPGRLEKDVALMKAAGITVVRLGESTWSKWEPADGQFDFAWMDRIVDAMGKAGIRVIMGTPTYSIPVWMYAKHPDMLARPLGGAAVGYGMRQNMNIDDPNYRRYAQRIVVALAKHYRDNPMVIGWQLDNETSAYGSSNATVHADFIEWLKTKYRTVDALTFPAMAGIALHRLASGSPPPECAGGPVPDAESRGHGPNRLQPRRDGQAAQRGGQ